MEIRAEFGRPHTSAQAWIRLPSISDKDYEIDDGSVEHCVYFKKFLMEIFKKVRKGDLASNSFKVRSIWMNTEDMRLLFRL